MALSRLNAVIREGYWREQVPYPNLFLFIFTTLLVYAIFLIGRSKGTARHLPGPPALPIIGNLHQIPKSGLYERFAKWAEQYGSIFALRFGASNVIVVCDRKGVHELLDKRGNIYSDRPTSYTNELLGVEENAFMLPMDDIWKIKRRVISHNLSPAQLDKSHFRVQEAEATVLLNDLLASPERFAEHIRRYTASIVHVLVHGFHASSYDDFWGHSVYKVMHARTVCLEPGSSPPFDEFPIFKYVPRSWFSWYHKADVSREVTHQVWTECRRRIDERRARGDNRDCMADKLLDEFNASGWPIGQQSFNQLLGEMAEGGADTSSASILTLILAWVIWPDVQTKARNELDAVCGTERTPQWSDFERLPYVNQIVKEGLRWRPVAPTALPHKLRQDDNYEGYPLAKDSIIFIGVWGLHHDRGHFTDPNVYNPERYNGYDRLASYYAGSPDYMKRDEFTLIDCLCAKLTFHPHHYAYGAGRRICPGIHLAERNMWRTAAKLLWAFEFSPALDASGNLIPLDPEAYTSGLTREPRPYKVQIKPRSEAHIATLKRELVDAQLLLENWQ